MAAIEKPTLKAFPLLEGAIHQRGENNDLEKTEDTGWVSFELEASNNKLRFRGLLVWEAEERLWKLIAAALRFVLWIFGVIVLVEILLMNKKYLAVCIETSNFCVTA